MKHGDVKDTKGNDEDLVDAVGYRPSTGLDEGIEAFVKWYKDFYKL